MPKYVTYLQLVLNPNSSNPGKIATALKKQGWWPVWGSYDFAWWWDSSWTPKDKRNYWTKMNRTHSTLKKLNVSCSFRTYVKGKEPSHVWYKK